MLVLSRKRGEKLFVGDNVTITVLEVQGNQIKIGIEAPESIHIRRSNARRVDPREAAAQASR